MLLIVFLSLSADHTSNWYSEHTLQITNNGSTDLELQLEEDLGWVNLDLNLDADWVICSILSLVEN